MHKTKTKLPKISALCLLTAMGVSAPIHSASAQEAYLGEVRMTAGTYCPRGWSEANGQLLPIASYNALFAVMGTVYGGDGRSTFALPDLRGRSPIHMGTGPGLSPFQQGQRGGLEAIRLTINELPQHNHKVQATNQDGNKRQPATDYPADPPSTERIYHDGPPDVLMADDMITMTGGSQPFGIRNPYLAMRYCVAIEGLFPPRN